MTEYSFPFRISVKIIVMKRLYVVMRNNKRAGLYSSAGSISAGFAREAMDKYIFSQEGRSA